MKSGFFSVLSALPERVRRANQSIRDPRLRRCVSRVGNYFERRFRPRAMQVPRVQYRANNIVTTVDDHRRNMTNAIDVFDQVVVCLEEAVVDEIMTLDPREGDGHLRLTEVVDH